MDILEKLNPAQKEAVCAADKYLRIVAGAGSGKTRVLITRIAYLISELGYNPAQILAITFTNKAAKEMQVRLNGMLGDLGAPVHISTIHSLCVSILRIDINALGYPRNFTIMDADDQKAILKEAYKEYGIDQKEFRYTNMLNYIGACKGEHVSGEYALTIAKYNQHELVKAKVYNYYLNRQEQMKALDFDDLLLFTVKIFKKYPNILSKWSKKFSTILVDEFQDVDRVQYELISLLVKSNDNELYVVGDPDQTIYTWRGADVNIIMNFNRDFSEAKTIYLNQNYRSSANILAVSNTLIANNRNRLEKDLFTAQNAGPKVKYFCALEEEIEVDFVCNQILAEVKAGRKYRDIVILYRSNYTSRAFEKQLASYRIPYRIYGGIRFYERAEIKDTICYLRMITSGDDLAFKRIINTPRRGIGNKSIELIENLAKQENTTYFEAIKNNLNSFSGKAKSELTKFIAMVDKWRNTQLPLVKMMELVLADTGYMQLLKDENDYERIENIKELQNDLLFFEKNNPEGTLDEYLQTIALITDKDVYEEGDYLSLMSVHSAKGLEFDTVFIVSFSDGVFPSERAMGESVNGIEEERRLAYVAMTRAKRQLYITNCQGFSYVLNQVKLPSRFISELDQAALEQIGVKPEKEVINPFLLDEGLPKNYGVVEDNPYKQGDLIDHKVFGKGVVLKIEEDMIKVAFSLPHGVKQLLATHPSISKRN